MQVHVMRPCRGDQLRLAANAWGHLASKHAQFRPIVRRRYSRLLRQDPCPLVAVSSLKLDFVIHRAALTAGLLHMSTLRSLRVLEPETCRFEAPRHRPAKVRYATSKASSGDEVRPRDQLQHFLWRKLFADPTDWCDCRRSKPTPLHPDFKHKKSKVALWLNNRHKPAWVDWQLATRDSGMKVPPESVCTSVAAQGTIGRSGAHEGHLEVEMCRKLCEHGRITDAVDVLTRLVQRGCYVANNLFYRVLKGCKDLVLGRHIHALTVHSGYDGDAFLATHLIGLYASHGRLEEAMRVFTNVYTPDAHNWATIIFACAKHGEAAHAIRLYRQMRESAFLKPDNRIYVAVLKACATAGDVVAGKEVHAHILAGPGKPDMFVQTALVDMYAKCGSLDHARSVFDRLPDKNVVMWTAMIAGYVQQEMGHEALSLYHGMLQDRLSPPDSVTYVCLLQACAIVGVGALDQGQILHAQIEKLGLHNDVVLGGSLIHMYTKCGSLGDARCVFDRLPDRNVVIWTTMIAGYAQQGMGQEALSLHSRLQQKGVTPPDSVTYVCLLQACALVGVEAVDKGKQLHAEIVELGLHDDVILGGSLVNMYASCGSLEDARIVFDRLPARNVVTWNSMIAGYAQKEMAEEALSLYSGMQQEGLTPPDSVAFVCVLQACASVGVGALDQGKQIHAQIEERGLQDDVALGGSLVNMYAKCGSLLDARRVFDRLLARNVVTWTAMISGYVQQGMDREAVSLYTSMLKDGITSPNSGTFVCLLQGCASLADLPLGKRLHAQILERGLQADRGVGAALVNMYAKCGSMFDSQLVFDSLPERTIEAWNALIGGYSRQGRNELVFDSLDAMRLQGIQPDGITFVSVLTVCSHVGLVGEGRKYFEAMRTEYGISPTEEHYRCMLDLLGRAGHLKEALNMAKTLPFASDGVVWLTLLAACQKWKNVEIGQEAMKFALSVDGKYGASYVLMSNIYAGAEMWEEAMEMQARRLKSGAWKKPGESWFTDMGGAEHKFVVGDRKAAGRRRAGQQTRFWEELRVRN